MEESHFMAGFYRQMEKTAKIPIGFRALFSNKARKALSRVSNIKSIRTKRKAEYAAKMLKKLEGLSKGRTRKIVDRMENIRNIRKNKFPNRLKRGAGYAAVAGISAGTGAAVSDSAQKNKQNRYY